MFIDKVRISVKAGAGGNGAVAFHREKYVAAGGPDGGDGGNGGSIVLRVDDNLSTLMDFRYKRKYTAPNGENGQGKRCRGKNGENLIIKVPRGTVVRLSLIHIFGGGNFVHASTPSTGVRVNSLDESYYKTRFLCGRRII